MPKGYGRNYTRFHQDHEQEPIYNVDYSGKTVRVGWQCRKCGIHWQKKQYGEKCLGMPRYNVRKYRPSHLFTRNELARKKLQPGSEPEGYVYVLNRPYWVFLYDIGKAQRLGGQK